MAKANSTLGKRIPKVRLAKPGDRPWQLRYTCPIEKREIRVSTGTHDQGEAEEQKRDLEAKLRLGLDAKPNKVVKGPQMAWEDFREAYTTLKVNTFRSDRSKDAADGMLDVCESIFKPRTLEQMARSETLAMIQSELLAGVKSRKGYRAPRSVRSYMGRLKTALNWAYKPMGWLPMPCEFELLDVDDDDAKGRPLTGSEFLLMLDACKVVCSRDPASWQFLLRGIWESGLRLDEAMHVHWTDDAHIRPLRTRNGGYLLRIPADRQKNRKTQDVPTTPLFGALLDEVPPDDRTGWIFNPSARRAWPHRLKVEVVGRLITDIGSAAGIVVNTKGKFASAHDLRRSFGQRMADAGVPPRDLQSIMRHASIMTTEKYYLKHRAVEQAERIAQYLGTGAAIAKLQEAAEIDATPCETR